MNYYNYFTEIEDRFQQRRGSLLMLSTLDWALIETWREASVPLEAVLRGIDAAFDKYDAQTARAPGRRRRKVNGLAWCAQAVLEAVEQGREAAVGIAPADARDSGFEPSRIARFLNRNAAQLEAAVNTPFAAAGSANSAAITETAARLRNLAASFEVAEQTASQNAKLEQLNLQDLDRTLTVLEEKLLNALVAAAPEEQVVALRAQSDRELAPYRGKMHAVQIRQVQQQLLHKRLFEAHSLPRLSLFYMAHEDEA